jgi:hypothetical protein
MTFIWLWVGEKSTMHESWPACGGSTRVGTTSAVEPAEKSRRRATGHSSTISFGECQRGRSWRLASVHQRRMSSNTVQGAAPRAMAPDQ